LSGPSPQKDVGQVFAAGARAGRLGTVERIEQGTAPNPTLRVFLAIAVLDLPPVARLEYRPAPESARSSAVRQRTGK